jgi:hypothetical protein
MNGPLGLILQKLVPFLFFKQVAVLHPKFLNHFWSNTGLWLPFSSMGFHPLLHLSLITASSHTVPSINELAKLSPSKILRGCCIFTICSINDKIYFSTGVIGVLVPQYGWQIALFYFPHCQISDLLIVILVSWCSLPLSVHQDHFSSSVFP